eukprot:scaffold290_cov367-Pinguiococcus_pyrenoidosus.AAC.8
MQPASSSAMRKRSAPGEAPPKRSAPAFILFANAHRREMVRGPRELQLQLGAPWVALPKTSSGAVLVRADCQSSAAQQRAHSEAAERQVAQAVLVGAAGVPLRIGSAVEHKAHRGVVAAAERNSRTSLPRPGRSTRRTWTSGGVGSTRRGARACS